eukprot:347947-Chlamydomonas_euryale.AAC.4
MGSRLAGSESGSDTAPFAPFAAAGALPVGAPPAADTSSGALRTMSLSSSADSVQRAVRYADCTSGVVGTGSSFCSAISESILSSPSWMTIFARSYACTSK